jgi:orotate phosphoribosyltransferase
MALDEKVAQEIQERGLNILAKHKGGFTFTPTFVVYTSAEIGPYYVQSGVVQNDGQDYANAIIDMITLIKANLSEDYINNAVFSGGETRDWIFSNPVAATMLRPHVMIYKDGKMVGADIKGKNVIHIADLNNEGSSPRDSWVPIIKKAEGKIENIFFYVDRMEDGVKVMEELKLNRFAAVPLNEHAWDYLQKKNVVSSEIYGNLMKRMENKDDWARKMLVTDAGIETLGALLATGKNREKGLSVMNKGYPDMKDELRDRLTKRFGIGIGRFVA